MSLRTYWRGYIDAQNKNEHNTNIPIAFAKKEKTLKSLADLLDREILEMEVRSAKPYKGYMIKVFDLDKMLPHPKKIDADYIKGFFDATGKVFEKKLTVTSRRLSLFIPACERITKIELPKAVTPNKKYETQRLIVTGDKFTQLKSFFKQ